MLRPSLRKKRASGFTLAELLIALAILGVIATFTIPKILTAQANGKYNAIAKEDIAMVAAAYQQAQGAGVVSANTVVGDLTPYMNYVTTSTALPIDGLQGENNINCAADQPCLILHNGSVLQYARIDSFGGTATTNAVWFHIDPNGSYSGTTNSSDKSVGIFLYYNGKIVDEGNIVPGTQNSLQSYSASSSKMPPWFSWQQSPVIFYQLNHEALQLVQELIEAPPPLVLELSITLFLSTIFPL
jgi:prepilin-type N-terminal cleavage/methylation domain-containing protein